MTIPEKGIPAVVEELRCSHELCQRGIDRIALTKTPHDGRFAQLHSSQLGEYLPASRAKCQPYPLQYKEHAPQCRVHNDRVHNDCILFQWSQGM